MAEITKDKTQTDKHGNTKRTVVTEDPYKRTTRIFDTTGGGNRLVSEETVKKD